jgi:hypothetical protein
LKLVFLSFEIITYLLGGNSGTVLAAVQQLALEFRRGDTIVAISVDLGEKYLDTIYNPAWVEKVIVPENDRPAPTYASVATELAQKKHLSVALTAGAPVQGYAN